MANTTDNVRIIRKQQVIVHLPPVVKSVREIIGEPCEDECEITALLDVHGHELEIAGIHIDLSEENEPMLKLDVGGIVKDKTVVDAYRGLPLWAQVAIPAAQVLVPLLVGVLA